MIFKFAFFNSIMEMYLKNIHLLPGHDYRLEMETYGGCINIYISDYSTRCGFGCHYLEASDTWQPRTFKFSTQEKATPQDLSIFSEWGLSFVKNYGDILPTASGNTYVRNIRLIDESDPARNLIAGGDFSEPYNSSVYSTNWRSTVLGEKGRSLGVDIVEDPLSPQGHCLLLPETISMSYYPEQLPLSCSYCGVLKNNGTDISQLLHHSNRILLVKRGRAEVSFEGKSLIASDNQAIFVPTSNLANARMYSRNNAEYYWISVCGEYAQAFLAGVGFSDFAVHTIHDVNTLIPYINALVNISYGNKAYLYEVSSHVQLFLAEWEKQQHITIPSVHRASIEKIALAIQQSPEHSISNDDLADSLGITTKHFISIFKNHIGMPPQKYRLQQLIKKACVLLQDTTMTVQEISYALGVNDPQYFSRLFKSIQGVSPKEYRKQPIKTHAL